MGYYSLLGAMSNFRDFEEIAGSSAGALLGLFLCVGKTHEEIIKFSFSINMSDFIKPTIKDFIKTYGFIQYDEIKQLLIQFCGCNPTFRELKKKLYVSAYCLNRMETHYFSVDSHPDMYVIDAVCMSTTIPVLFSTCTHNGNIYIDGGTFERIPYLPFVDKKSEDILVIEVDDWSEKRTIEINNLYDFLISLFTNFLKYRIAYKNKTISIKIPDSINLVNFFMDYEDKMRLYMLGKKL